MKNDIEKSFSHLDKQIDVILRYHPTAKKMRLRIDTKTKKALVIMPKYTTQKRAMEFAMANASWLLSRIQNAKPKIIIKDKVKLTVLGEEFTVSYQNKLRGVTEMQDGKLLVYGEETMIRKRVIDYIKSLIKPYIEDIASRYSIKLGTTYSKILIKDTSSRWGSCNSQGEISICWKLAFAPVPILDYIIIHEVVHLKHFDHSPSFWKTVGRFFPEYEKAQSWLEKHQSRLQNIG